MSAFVVSGVWRGMPYAGTSLFDLWMCVDHLADHNGAVFENRFHFPSSILVSSMMLMLRGCGSGKLKLLGLAAQQNAGNHRRDYGTDQHTET